MSRQPSPKKYEALKIWLKSGRMKQPKEIAEEIGVSPNLVRKWKSIDKWDEIPDRKGPGAPYRNKNAVGNKGGPGGPPGNDKAVKHGLFRKFLPDDEGVKEIYDAIPELSTLDLLYEKIRIAFTNLIHAQKVMFVKDQRDETRVLKKQKVMENDKGSSEEYEWEYQHAWDKQGRALTSQAAAMRTISNMIKQYEEMVRSLPPDEVKEEHRLRIEKLKVDIKATEMKGF